MRALALVPVLVLLFASAAWAQDSWPMFRGDMRRTGYTNMTGDLSGYEIAWKYSTPNGVFGSPASADLDGNGMPDIVVPLEKAPGSAQESVIALDNSGKRLWSFSSRGGVHSSPAIADLDGDGDLDVVFGTNEGEVCALEGSSGEELWLLDEKVGAFRSSPLVYDLDGDGNAEVFIGYSRGELYAIDGESGIIEWTYGTDDEITSSPTLADLDDDPEVEIAFGSADGFLYAVNGDGTPAWRMDAKAPMVYSTAAVLPSGRVLAVGTYDGRLLLVRGGKASSYDIGVSITGSPGVAFDRNRTIIVFGGAEEKDLHGLYVKDPDNKIYCVDSDGNLLWERSTDGWGVFSSPALADVDRDGSMEAVVGSREGRLYVLDAATGEVEWSYLDGTGMYASPILVDMDGDDDLEAVIAYRYSNQVQLIDSFEKPDLTIDSISFSNPFPKENEKISINITVKNEGNLESGPSKIALYRRSPLMDHPIGGLSVPAIGERENASVVFAWEAKLPPGKLGVYAVADPGDSINESDETNNGHYQDFPSDLSISDYVFPEEIRGKRVGGKAEIQVTLLNRGRLDLMGVEAALLLGNETGEKEVTRKSVDVKAGREVGLKFAFDYEPSETEQTISVVADPDGDVVEEDEGNNAVEWTIAPVSEAAPPPPAEPATKEKMDVNIIMVLLLVVIVAIAWKKGVKKIKEKSKKKKKKAKKEAEAKEEKEAQEFKKERIEGAKTAEEEEEEIIKIGGEEKFEEGPDEGDAELGRLRKEKEKLEQMMGIAKRKFYKRQLSQDSYQDLVVRNQEKIIEIEAEIEKRKKNLMKQD